MALRFRQAILLVFFSSAVACGLNAQDGPVYNGSFEKTTANGRQPAGWQVAGDKAVVQELTAEHDPGGATWRGFIARGSSLVHRRATR